MRVSWGARWAAALLCVAIAEGPLSAQGAEVGAASGAPRHSAPPLPSPAPLPADPGQTAKPTEPLGPAPEAAAAAIGEFQPVLHAQGAKITTCMDTIVGESASVIDSTHTAISSWNNVAPNENLFTSIVGLSYANKAAPNGAAIILAAPTGADKCEGETVQVYPFARSCSAIQASLIKDGRTIATLQALPVVETKAGVRNVLIPTAGGGCVVVAVTMRE